MPEPEVGKCYRWASNKYDLGKFIKSEKVSYRDRGRHGENLGMVNTVYYTFSKQTISEATLGNVEEYSCPAVTGGSRRSMRKKSKRRSSRRMYKQRQ